MGTKTDKMGGIMKSDLLIKLSEQIWIYVDSHAKKTFTEEKATVLRYMVNMGYDKSELDLALEVMNQDDDNVAEFGIFKKFLFSRYESKYDGTKEVA